MSLRERKKAATRARVMAAALRLFAERGFEVTTCEEIAAVADIAPRTFFRYFPTKADVLFGDHDDVLEALREALATRSPEESVVRVVKRWAQEGLDHLLVSPSRYLTRTGLVASIPAAYARSRQLDAEFEDVIAAAISGPGAPTDIGACLTARAAWGATRAARDVWLASDGELDPRRLVDEAFDLLERGL
jgi:AcrR family transcriptional regulator